MDVLSSFKNISFLRLLNIDFVLLAIILVLTIIGLAQVFASTYFFELGMSSFFKNHLFFSSLGIVIVIFLPTLNIIKILNNNIITIFTIIITSLLVVVLFFGTFAYEARRWLTIGEFTIQPSEFAKILIVMLISKFFDITSQKEIFVLQPIYKGLFWKIKFLLSNSYIQKFLILLSISIVVVMIFLQKSLGNTIFLTLIVGSICIKNIKLSKSTVFVLISFLFGILLSFLTLNHYFVDFITLNLVILIPLILLFLIKSLKEKIFQLKIFFFIVITTIGINLLPILQYGYNNLLQPFQRERLMAFFDNSPEKAKTSNYNKEMAFIAYTSGGIVGNGYMQGRLTNSGYLPFAYTDFAFASFVEQMGLIWGVIIITLYFSLLFRVFNISKNTSDKFLQNISFGIGFMLMLNIVQHIGMNLGILPITGVPLPFLSYGGSALLTVFIGISIVMSIDLVNKGYIRGIR